MKTIKMEENKIPKAEKNQKKGSENPNRAIKIEKITLNIGAGKDQALLEKGIQLIKHITGVSPVKTMTKKRIPSWGLRPGLPVGCKLTIRGKKAVELMVQFLGAKENKLSENNFDKDGNIAFGIHEYIDIPNVKYVPEIGLMGLQICITLERTGFRIKKRCIKKKKIPSKHQISQEEAIKFMQDKFKVKMEEEE